MGISYKVPQAVAVVEQPVQMSISIPERKKPINTMPPHVKDIVAEAMREVEESNQKKQQATAIAIKSEPHVAVDPQQQHIIHQQPQHIQQQIIQEEPRDVKPNIAAVNAATALSKGEPAKPITA